MTKNFKILKDFNVSKNHNKEIINSIDTIEEFLMKNDKKLKYCYKEASNVIVKILLEEFDENEQFKLNNAIKEIVSKKCVPTIVEDALYSLKRIRNEDSHPQVLKTDIPYKIKPDFSSVIEVLKNIWIIVKFFVKERNPDEYDGEKDREYQWNSIVYYGNKKEMIDDKSLVENIPSDLIKTKLVTIFDLIASNVSFLVPNYQREYNWSIDEVEIFLDDINKCINEKKIKLHYLGSIALGVSDEKEILHIIDGQQRITTSLLIIRATINYFEKSDMEMPSELAEIKDKLSSKYANNTAKYSPLEYVKKILRNETFGDVDFKKSVALANYNFIEKKLEKMSISDFKEFYATFNRKFVISRVNFNSDLKDEIEIFENLNSKGTHLSDWDLIKNYIYKSVDTSLLLKNEDKIRRIINDRFIKKGSQFFKGEKNEKIAKFFKFYCRIFKKIKDGKILSSNDNKKVTQKSKTLRNFSNLWPKNNDHNLKFKTILEISEALIEPARLFHIFCLLESKEYLNEDSKLFKLWLHLENLSIKDVHFPLVMYSIYENSYWANFEIQEIPDENMELLKLLISDIDKYVTRLLVANNVGQSLSGVFDRCIYKSIKTSYAKFKETVEKDVITNTHTLPPIKKFQKEIKEKNDWQPEYAKSFLRTVSWSKNSMDSRKNKIYKDFELELIFPQKAIKGSKWFEETNLSWEEYINKIGDHTQKIGNFLVVENRNNKVKNKSFMEKKEFYKKYADNDLLKMDFNFLNSVNIIEKNNFTFDDIDKRSEEMSKLVPLLYKLSFEK